MTVIPFDNLDGWTSLYDTPVANGVLTAHPGPTGIFWIERTNEHSISGTISVVADLTNDPSSALFLIGFGTALDVYWAPYGYGAMIVTGGAIWDSIPITPYSGKLVVSLDITGSTYTAKATPLGASVPLYTLSGTLDQQTLDGLATNGPMPTLAGYENDQITYDDFTFTKTATYVERVDYPPVVLTPMATRSFSRPLRLIQDYGGTLYDFRTGMLEPPIVPHGPGINEFDPGYDSAVPVHALPESGGTEFPGGEQFQAFTDVPAMQGSQCQVEVTWSETHRETFQASDLDWRPYYSYPTDPSTVPIHTLDDLIITQDPNLFYGAAYTPEATIRFKPVGGVERTVTAGGAWAPGAISYTNRQRALHSSGAVQTSRIGDPALYNSYQHTREWMPASTTDPDVWHYPTEVPANWKTDDTVGADTITFTRRYLLRPDSSGSGSSIFFDEIPERLGLVRQFLTKLNAAAVTDVKFTITAWTPGYWTDGRPAAPSTVEAHPSPSGFVRLRQPRVSGGTAHQLI